MTRLGVVGALEPEIRAFGLRRQRRSGEGTDPVLLAVSGMGAERAYRAGKRLIDEGATALVSWGSAAALVPTLVPGTLLLPESVIARNGAEFEIDAGWQRRLRARLPMRMPLHAGPLAEAGAPLLSAADKRRLAQRSGAAAADMESAALAALAHEARLPLIIIRAIADSAGTAVPPRLAAAIRSDGSLRVVSTMAWLACSPSQWLTAWRLAWGFRAALLTLQRIAHEVRACT